MAEEAAFEQPTVAVAVAWVDSGPFKGSSFEVGEPRTEESRPEAAC